MKPNSFAPLGAFLLAGLVPGPHVVLGEDEPAGTLEPTVVSAHRAEMPSSEVGSAVTFFEGADIEHRQLQAFETLLHFVPGAAYSANAQRGSVSSLFLRGTESDHTQIVIDGIRINDANLLSNSFLGGARAHHLSSVEVLRGPQSALYGGEAIGGVITLSTPRAQGDPLLTWDASVGDFDSFHSGLSAQDARERTAWSLSVGRESTDNDRPNNAFEQAYYAGRFDFDLTDAVRTGFTLRGADRALESPGSIFQNDPDNIDEEEFLLFTTWLEADLTPHWNSRLTYGLVEQQLTNRTPPIGNRIADYRNHTGNWHNVVTWDERFTTVWGANLEASSVEDSGFGDIAETDTQVAVYGQQTAEVLDGLTLTGGGRWEEYESFGSVWTWRTTGAYHLTHTGTTLRASYGTGFRAPSFLDLFGFDPPNLAFFNPGFVGNPNLRPETSRGWDAGFEQRLFGTFSVAATWFENDLRDLIVFSPDFPNPSSVINLGAAHTQGLEVELRGDWTDRISGRLAYTYLQAEDEIMDTRLLRRPEHTLGFDVFSRWCDGRLTVGLGGYHLQNRLDLDAQTFSTIDGDDFFVARLYGACQVTDFLEINLRVENAFDEDYEEVDGFPGRSRGTFAGVKLTF